MLKGSRAACDSLLPAVLMVISEHGDMQSLIFPYGGLGCGQAKSFQTGKFFLVHMKWESNAIT